MGLAPNGWLAVMVGPGLRLCQIDAVGSGDTRPTASFQPAYLASRSSVPMWGSKRRSQRQLAGDLVERGVDAGAEAREIGGAEGGGFHDLGAFNRAAGEVGEPLAEDVVDDHAAVDAQRARDCRGRRRDMSAAIASRRSRVWKQTDSSPARAISAWPVSRVMPTIAPRASGSQ